MYNSFCNLNKINIISLKLKAYSSFYNVNDSIFLFIIDQVGFVKIMFGIKYRFIKSALISY
jgi:hypothetical protein